MDQMLRRLLGTVPSHYCALVPSEVASTKQTCWFRPYVMESDGIKRTHSNVVNLLIGLTCREILPNTWLRSKLSKVTGAPMSFSTITLDIGAGLSRYLSFEFRGSLGDEGGAVSSGMSGVLDGLKSSHRISRLSEKNTAPKCSCE